MEHARTDIRVAVVTKLKAFIDSGLREKLYLSRPDPLFLPELPAILVYYKNEDTKVIVGAENFPKLYERILSLTIDIIIEGAEDPDTALDRIAAQIEACFYDDPTFGDLCYGCRLFNTVPVSIEAEGDRSIECQRLTWQITYESKAYLDRRINEFLEFHADIYNPGVQQFLIGSHTTMRTK
jgi:hypothetical protein